MDTFWLHTLAEVSPPYQNHPIVIKRECQYFEEIYLTNIVCSNMESQYFQEVYLTNIAVCSNDKWSSNRDLYCQICPTKIALSRTHLTLIGHPTKELLFLSHFNRWSNLLDHKGHHGLRSLGANACGTWIRSWLDMYEGLNPSEGLQSAIYNALQKI